MGDLLERRRLGHPGCSCPLLLHARVLDPDWKLPHCLPLHRLVNHSSVADGGVLLDPLCSAAQHWRRHVLAVADWHYRHVGLRLLWRDGHLQPLVRLHGRHGRMGVHPQRDLPGQAGTVAAGIDKVSPHVKSSFAIMRFIVTVGWSIYPLGYFFGYLMGQVNDDVLNLVYNLADFVNKIAFCLAIWQSAKRDTGRNTA